LIEASRERIALQLSLNVRKETKQPDAPQLFVSLQLARQRNRIDSLIMQIHQYQTRFSLARL